MLKFVQTLAHRLAWLLMATASYNAGAKDLIKIEGSSTVYPITQEVAQQFMRAEGTQTQVVVGITGTGGGFRKFCRGRTDISNASRPITESEKSLCKTNGIEFIELPVALDAITVVVNKQNIWLEALSIEELNLIWRSNSEQQITRWDQINHTYPPYPLRLHGPGPDSGTYDYFVNVVLDNATSRRDYIENEDDTAMVAEVAADKNALAFLGFAYYTKNQNKLKAVAITDSNNDAFLPSVKNVTDGRYSALSRPLFIYVNKHSLDNRDSLRRFLTLYLQQDHIRHNVAKSGYIPLSPDMYTVARSILLQGKTGSVFNNEDLSANFQRFLSKR